MTIETQIPRLKHIPADCETLVRVDHCSGREWGWVREIHADRPTLVWLTDGTTFAFPRHEIREV